MRTEDVTLFPELAAFEGETRSEFDRIPAARRLELERLADYVRASLKTTSKAALTFICTHNSRRSHLSQIWAKVAADIAGLRGVATFSGGTEATAMNPRVVDSLRRTGLEVKAEDTESENPVYLVSYSTDAAPLRCFSKVYDQAPNPTKNFCAVMTCSSADRACPVVSGSEARIPIRYEDPKVADGTAQEAEVYDERSRQIFREMLYTMARA